MSRAFVTEGDPWAYCPKAGERCMMAEPGKDCRDKTCKYYNRDISASPIHNNRDKIVRRVKK